MTPEKLAELEALEAAATPGEWETSEDLDIGASDFQIPVTYDDGSEVMPGYTHSMRVVSLPYGQPDTWPRHNAALICTLRNNARDLFAALREAWRERDEAQAALRLLWAEANDNVRCRYMPEGHHISEPCRAAVKAVLGEG